MHTSDVHVHVICCLRSHIPYHLPLYQLPIETPVANILQECPLRQDFVKQKDELKKLKEKIKILKSEVLVLISRFKTCYASRPIDLPDPTVLCLGLHYMWDLFALHVLPLSSSCAYTFIPSLLRDLSFLSS